MKVGVYYRNSDVRVENRPTPEMGNDDVLLKVMASGVCGSDLMEWYRIKKAPLVLGHELAGEVVDVGKHITQWKNGDRVFATHHVPCDECYFCQRQHETACQVFQTVNNFDPGGFAQFLKVSGRSLQTGMLKLPENMAYSTATFIEPLGTVVRGLRAIDLAREDSVLVYGAGIAGLLYVKLAVAMGAARVMAVDITHSRLAFAQKQGALPLKSSSQAVVEELRQVNQGRLADKVIVCAGALPAVDTALKCVERGGTALLFAVPKPEEKVEIDANGYWRNDITIKTCYGAAPRDNREALDLLESGKVDVSDMITHRYSLDEIGDAFRMAAQPDQALKVVVMPNGNCE